MILHDTGWGLPVDSLSLVQIMQLIIDAQNGDKGA
jgi:hypothetical protein